MFEKINIGDYKKIIVKLNDGIGYMITKFENHGDKVVLYKRNEVIDEIVKKYLQSDSKWEEVMEMTVEKANEILEGYMDVAKRMKQVVGEKASIKFEEKDNNLYIVLDVER